MKTDAGKGKQAGVKRAIHFGRRLLPLLIAVGFNYSSALANPVGPQVINGQAGFNNQGNLLTITNSPGAIINWQSFSVNPGEITRFLQQNPGSTVLNRIIGQDPSQILGALQSNGRVFLINPNGILFGPGAQIDVNGLVASTLNIGNDDFLAGKLNFKAGDKAGNVSNQGAITTPNGGQVYLIAPHIENSGVITSPNGEVMLAAGNSVQLVDSTNPDLRVVVSAPTDQAINLGQIVAQGGRIGIYGALVNQRGRISADSAVVGENGKIIFKASKDTLLEAGSVTSATGAGKGGEIQVLGERVGLTGDARIDASGRQGGGTVLVGGDYQGKNPDIQNASITYFDSQASIKADAIANGDGGKVIVWSDDTTRAYGHISAKGGEQGGNGGFVETSGKRVLDFKAAVETSAPRGKPGTLLLDPADITIGTIADVNGDSTLGDDVTAPGILSSTDQGVSSQITAAQLSTLLETNNIALAATNDITVSSAIAPATGTNSLELNAGHNINLGANITLLGAGGLTLQAGNNIQQDGNITSTGSASVNVTGASISMGTLGSGNAVKTQTTGGTITYTSTAGAVSVGLLDSGAGSVTIDSATNILDNNAGGLNIYGSSAGLFSRTGAAASGLAISLDTKAANLTAEVIAGSYADISLRNQVPVTIGMISTPGAVTLTNAGSVATGSISGNSVSITTTVGDITVNTMGSINGSSSVMLNAAQDVLVNGGNVYAVGTATINAGRDIRVSGFPGVLAGPPAYGGSIAAGSEVYLTANSSTGGLYLTSNGAYASVSAGSVATVYLNLPNRSSGGYFIDGTEGGLTYNPQNPSTGIFAANVPAVVGSSLLIQHAAPPPDPCVTNPASCLPTLAQCIANPSLSGCSAVLPSIAQCVLTPTAAGCSVVLPTLTACIAAPATAGCTVVLPTLIACIANPATAGCSVVLPTLTACIAAPATAGCSVVLPTLTACIAAPATAGCTVVLPTLTACIANPATAGCSVVLPTLTACIAAPATAGCSVVLPTLTACIAAPATAGCSVVLPTLSQCVSTPTLAGCSVVLPTLAQCTATPTLIGCSAVLPTVSQCAENPTRAGCEAVLPTAQTPANAPVMHAINTTINVINTSTVKVNDSNKTDDDVGSGKDGQTSGSKKGKKKDTTGSDKTGAKNDADKKMYCN